MSNKNEQHYQQATFDQARPETRDLGPVTCLGMTFPNDEERRKHFLGILRAGLEELHDKLAVPFTSAEDTAQRLRSLQRWPLGGEDRIQHLARRIAESARSARGQDRTARDILQLYKDEVGFPHGAIEDILALSDPPYHTACPNPFIADFIRERSASRESRAGESQNDPGPMARDPQAYHREPFAVDVSEGKTAPLYRAHSYHTKVPHLAIVPSILHYTEPGDVVLDGFCGSGMTGVAAQWCGCAPEAYRRTVEADFERRGLAKPAWGARKVVLADLSPYASFIASNYNLPFDVSEFARAGQAILDEVEQEIGWMYETRHTDGKSKGRIEYTVWSEVFACPECAGEVVFLDEALDEESKRVKETFPCPHCGAVLNKDNLDRVFQSRVDPATNCPWRRVRFRPSLISYVVDGKRHEKQPDEADLRLLEQIEQMPLPPELPANRFPTEEMYHGSRIEPKGFTRVHHFYLPRAGQALAALWRKAQAHPDARIRHALLFFVEQAVWGLSVFNRYQPIMHGRVGGSQVNRQMTGVYYVASQLAECSPWYSLGGKLDRLSKAFQGYGASKGMAAITTGSTAWLGLPDDSVDYIFTDPPFGENIYYADLNFLTESWHRVITNPAPEAIVDRFKSKGLPKYQRLMQRCFEEYYRALKPGRWMTVVFHNSRNAVWNAIQEAMQAAGFVVADVRTLDKQQGSYRQVTSTAVKQDLVISAYKPNGGLEERFRLVAGSESGVWDFVRAHLTRLPAFVSKGGKVEVILERQAHLLYDRMVAFHVQRGVMVPLSAAEFYAGLVGRFPERDGMYFLPEQVAEYDQKRMTAQEVLQLQLIVTDESSAIQWLRQQLTDKPQTFQELHPQFLREIGGWQKHEKPLELSELLEENFLRFDGQGPIPAQIVSWLKQDANLRKLIESESQVPGSWSENRGLQTINQQLLREAKDRWYVPDPNKAGDLEKLRERHLLKEFAEYQASSHKRLKVFRLEAVRAGFKKAWQERDHATIIAVARRIPEEILQEDPKLLMWYDQAVTRAGSQ